MSWLSSTWPPSRPLDAGSGGGQRNLPKQRNGGAEGTRTPDPLVANEVRYQLRHSPLTASKVTAAGMTPCSAHERTRAGSLRRGAPPIEHRVQVELVDRRRPAAPARATGAESDSGARGAAPRRPAGRPWPSSCTSGAARPPAASSPSTDDDLGDRLLAVQHGVVEPRLALAPSARLAGAACGGGVDLPVRAHSAAASGPARSRGSRAAARRGAGGRRSVARPPPRAAARPGGRPTGPAAGPGRTAPSPSASARAAGCRTSCAAQTAGVADQKREQDQRPQAMRRCGPTGGGRARTGAEPGGAVGGRAVRTRACFMATSGRLVSRGADRWQVALGRGGRDDVRTVRLGAAASTGDRAPGARARAWPRRSGRPSARWPAARGDGPSAAADRAAQIPMMTTKIRLLGSTLTDGRRGARAAARTRAVCRSRGWCDWCDLAVESPLRLRRLRAGGPPAGDAAGSARSSRVRAKVRWSRQAPSMCRYRTPHPLVAEAELLDHPQAGDVLRPDVDLHPVQAERRAGSSRSPSRRRSARSRARHATAPIQ